MTHAVSFGRHPADAPIMVGREREQRLLRDHLSAVVAGQGRLVLVGGEAGIGKTTLVGAVAAEAAAQGALVLSGACYDLIATPPYGPWRDLAAGYPPADHLPPPPAVLAVGDGGDATSQTAIFAQVRDFFADVAALRPVVLILEDLHWTDPASLDLLRYLARQLTTLPVLLVVTYRSDELTRRHPLYQALPALVREGRGDRIDLRRLDDGDLKALVAARGLFSDEDAARLVAYLRTHAEGNPFYAHELLRMLEEEGVLRQRGEDWAVGDLGRVRVPELLRQVVDGRLARLGEEIREPLAMAAVIGQEVPFDLWRAVADVPEEALLTTVERAVEAHLLDAADGSRVRFTHALIREALYEGVLPLRRRGWHRRVGEALADTSGADPDAVAFHFQQAGDGRAAEWLVRAGERAQRAYAWVSATERFAASAAALEGDAAHARERGWLLYRIGRLLRFADPVQGIAYLEEAERVAAGVEDPELAAYALADQGMLRCFAGKLRRGLAEMAAGVEALDDLPVASTRTDVVRAAWVADALPESAHARVRDGERAPASGVNPRRGALIFWLAVAGRYADVAAMGASQLAELEAVAQPDEAVLSSAGDAHHGLGHVAAVQGRPDAASEAFARARVAHRAIDHHIQVAGDAIEELATVHVPYRTTQLDERRQLRAEVAAAWSRVGSALPTGGPPHLAYFGRHMELLLLEGDWADVQVLVDAAHVHPAVLLWQNVIGNLAWLAYHQGRSALVWAMVHEKLPDGPATEPGGSQFWPTVVLQHVATELALDAGDLPNARAWIEAHDRWLAGNGSVLGQADGLLLWARYHRAAGDIGQARRCAADALERASEPRQPLALLAAHRQMGELATEAGEAIEAEPHLQAALTLADACAAPYERALTLLTLAELRAATSRTSEARDLLDEVRVICEPLGAAPALAWTDALATRLTAAPVTYPAGLSGREVEVLRLVAEGLTDGEVAARLFISPRTVGQHLRSVYTKLGVSSRAAATRLAVEYGLL